MARYLTQILEEINESPKNIHLYKNEAALVYIFQHAFDPDKKFVLPEGDPPYKLAVEPLGMTPANIRQETRRFYIFCRKDLTNIKRESLFIQMLESVHPTEAKIILAVKDQKFTDLYPNITHKLVYEAGFPVSEPVEPEQVLVTQSTEAEEAPPVSEKSEDPVPEATEQTQQVASNNTETEPKKRGRRKKG